MPPTASMAPYFTYVLYAAALLLTLCLAAWLTPRSWWRRPNARALALLVGGTALLGGLLHVLFGASSSAPSSAPSGFLTAAVAAPAAHALAPVAGERYRVHDDLNLRAAVGVNAPRLGVVPAGAQVTATGRRQGDWWQVSVELEGLRQQGWASSLWLRRRHEGA